MTVSLSPLEAILRIPPSANQPRPLQYFLDRLDWPGRVVTALTRCWDPATISQCRLCPTCRADRVLGVCQVLVDQAVTHESAPLFSTRGLTALGESGPAARYASPD